jgi:hypothetical protein
MLLSTRVVIRCVHIAHTDTVIERSTDRQYRRTNGGDRSSEAVGDQLAMTATATVARAGWGSAVIVRADARPTAQ